MGAVSKPIIDLVTRTAVDLIDAHDQLRAMSAEYGKAKAAFDARMARQGIYPDAGPEGLIAYVAAKEQAPELGYWYSKVEHWQREVTARAAVITALADAQYLGELYDEGRGVAVAGCHTCDELLANPEDYSAGQRRRRVERHQVPPQVPRAA